MEAILAPRNILKKLQDSKKNSLIILGNEPVVSNHIKKDIKESTDIEKFEYQPITIDSSLKIEKLQPIFENNSLFSNKILFNINIPGGKITEEIKKFFIKVISENTENIHVFHFQNNTKDLLKSAWFKDIKKSALQFDAKEPSINQIENAVKIRANFHKLNLDSESISLLSNLSLGNLLVAENELIKLSLIDSNNDINVKKLISLMSNGSKFDTFELLNFCMTGNSKKTAQALIYFEEEGIEPVMLNGLFSWIFNAISKLKFSLNEPITNKKLMELRIFGSSQELVSKAIKKLSKKQIEASLLKIKEIDLICKGLRTGDPWLELNRFAFGISRLFDKKSE